MHTARADYRNVDEAVPGRGAIRNREMRAGELGPYAIWLPGAMILLPYLVELLAGIAAAKDPADNVGLVLVAAELLRNQTRGIGRSSSRC